MEAGEVVDASPPQRGCRQHQQEMVSRSRSARAAHERGRIGLLILLLTLTAAWIDMLFLPLSGSRVRLVYDGQLLFIGLGVVQAIADY